MRERASTTCDRCGSEMSTNLGVKYSEWRQKKERDDESLHCSDCRAELAEPTERRIGIDASETEHGIEFTVSLYNPTEEAVGFSLKPDFFEEETQWEDMDCWPEAAGDSKGLVGVLEVFNEEREIVFTGEMRSWFTIYEILDSQMLIGGESSRSYSLQWIEGERTEYTHEHNRYLGAPDTSYDDHELLEAVFRLEAEPRNEWPQRRARATFFPEEF